MGTQLKKAVIYVYSGTGNTLLVAQLFKKYFEGYETTIHQVRMNRLENPPKDDSETEITLMKKGSKFAFFNVPDPNEFDLVGFGYPVHGFNTPSAMYDFIKLLPSVEKGKKAFILKSSGEGLTFNNYSSQKWISKLEKKGYDILCERHFVMPYNMIFRHTPEMVKNEYIYADALARMSCKQLQTEDFKEKVKYCPLKYWFVPIVRILWVYARVQGPTMFADKKKCIKCGKCANLCPLENIKLKDGMPKFGTNCVLCVACSFNCPTKAISIGLLNNWRVNGSYKIEETAQDQSIPFGYFGENLKGFHRFLYYKYYRRLEKALKNENIELNN